MFASVIPYQQVLTTTKILHLCDTEAYRQESHIQITNACVV